MKILHLIEKGSGLRQAPEGYLESLVWALDGDEQAAEYVALHKQKSQRSWKGGRILGMREATEEELAARVEGPGVRRGNLVVQFEPIRRYNGRPGVPWGGKRKGSMTYKSLQEVKEDQVEDLLN